VNHLHCNDRVEWIGPPSNEEGDPQPGQAGTVLTLDPPGEWVVHFDRAGTMVVGDRHIKKIDATHDT
jgi:hypothetical protein